MELLNRKGIYVKTDGERDLLAPHKLMQRFQGSGTERMKLGKIRCYKFIQLDKKVACSYPDTLLTTQSRNPTHLSDAHTLTLLRINGGN